MTFMGPDEEAYPQSLHIGRASAPSADVQPQSMGGTTRPREEFEEGAGDAGAVEYGEEVRPAKKVRVEAMWWPGVAGGRTTPLDS